MTLLASLGVMANAHANIETTTKTVVFSKQEIATDVKKSVTLTNKGASATDLTGMFNVVSSNPNFTFDSSNCDKQLEVDATCNIWVTYNQQSEGDHSSLLVFDVDGDKTPIFASNYFYETNDIEASRRLPPVVEKIEIYDDLGTTKVTGNLSVNTTYTAKWAIMSYLPVLSEMKIFDCSQESNATDCATDSESHVRFLDTDSLNGATLSDSEVQSEGLEIYSYQGTKALHQTFSAQFTIDEVTNADEAALESTLASGDNLLGVRIYYRTERDAALQELQNTSAIFASGLDFQGQGQNAFIDSDGRRLKLMVTK